MEKTERDNYVDIYTATVSTAQYDYNRVETNTMIPSFDFLKQKELIYSSLEAIWSEILAATDSTIAFDFNSVKSLSDAKEVLDGLMKSLVTDLETLHTNICHDISDIATEVDENFNWAKVCSLTIDVEQKPVTNEAVK